MEELLRAQGLDLVVDPVKQRGVALRYCGSNGVLVAQLRNTYFIARILQCECDNLSVVIRPCDAVTVLQSILRGCVGVILLQRDIRIVIDQVGLLLSYRR